MMEDAQRGHSAGQETKYSVSPVFPSSCPSTDSNGTEEALSHAEQAVTLFRALNIDPCPIATNSTPVKTFFLIAAEL